LFRLQDRVGRFSYARIVDFFIAPLETCQVFTV
jgi:hypothetical protein